MGRASWKASVQITHSIRNETSQVGGERLAVLDDVHVLEITPRLRMGLQRCTLRLLRIESDVPEGNWPKLPQRCPWFPEREPSRNISQGDTEPVEVLRFFAGSSGHPQLTLPDLGHLPWALLPGSWTLHFSLVADGVKPISVVVRVSAAQNVGSTWDGLQVDESNTRFHGGLK